MVVHLNYFHVIYHFLKCPSLNAQLQHIEVMHKAWHDASAVKVGHFEWLTMYTGVTGQKRAKPVSLKQATIP